MDVENNRGSAQVECNLTTDLSYVLITPARNEEEFLEELIRSVIRQTILPKKWIIVSDGSTDGTDEIVRKFMKKNPWILLVRMSERRERHFAGKVIAFDAGYEKVKKLNYQIIGNIDADLSFDPEYFEFLLSEFDKDPELGVAGTPFSENGKLKYDYRFTNKEHVSGACQLFRRECYESIGGYQPLKRGGIDLVAVVSARMNGWKTRTFTEKTSNHHRTMGTANYGILKGRFRGGYHDYLLGIHPIWQLFRSLYQMTKKPHIISGGILLLGYCWAMLTRPKRPVSTEFVRFRRSEQMRRLGDKFRIKFLSNLFQ